MMLNGFAMSKNDGCHGNGFVVHNLFDSFEPKLAHYFKECLDMFLATICPLCIVWINSMVSYNYYFDIFFLIFMDFSSFSLIFISMQMR